MRVSDLKWRSAVQAAAAIYQQPSQKQAYNFAHICKYNSSQKKFDLKKKLVINQKLKYTNLKRKLVRKLH